MASIFYNYRQTYQWNCQNPPPVARSQGSKVAADQLADVFGRQIFPLGIPAGPLPTSRHCLAALSEGYGFVYYKTVRSVKKDCLPFPNVVGVNLENDLGLEQTLIARELKIDQAPTSITNSFGVPSEKPSVWQPDVTALLKQTPADNLVIVSFQGTATEQRDQLADYAYTAGLVANCGARVIEANLSCPNEGHASLICHNPVTTAAIALAIRQVIGHEVRLLLKLAYYPEKKVLDDLLEQTVELVDGYSVINTIPARIVDELGQPALPGRETSGVCGRGIKWAGLETVSYVNNFRRKVKKDFKIIGGGGVLSPQDYEEYRQAGADLVASATGAMFGQDLAEEVKTWLSKSKKAGRSRQGE
jgi:dihydroorotate dehydrogenase